MEVNLGLGVLGLGGTKPGLPYLTHKRQVLDRVFKLLRTPKNFPVSWHLLRFSMLLEYGLLLGADCSLAKLGKTLYSSEILLHFFFRTQARNRKRWKRPYEARTGLKPI